MQFTRSFLSFVLLGLSQAHPGHDLTQEIAERRSFIAASGATTLDHCTDKLRARGIEARNVARRLKSVEKARSAMGLHSRDLDELLAGSHNETDTGYTEHSALSDLFSGNSSCILTPEVTQGPYCKCTLK